MTLMDEINALRKDLDEVRRKQSKADQKEKAAQAGAAPQADAGADQPERLDALLGAVNTAVEDFSEEIERYPRIAAMTSLAVGLALGYAIGRQVR